MKISVFGDGAWGTALAMNLLSNGHRVTVWGAFPDYLDEMREKRENYRFLPGVTLPDELEFESDAVTAVRECDVILPSYDDSVYLYAYHFEPIQSGDRFKQA